MSKFSVRKDGLVFLPGKDAATLIGLVFGSSLAPSAVALQAASGALNVVKGDNSDWGAFGAGTTHVNGSLTATADASLGGSLYINASTGDHSIYGPAFLGWTSGTALPGVSNAVTRLYRDSDHVIAQRNGANGQTQRWYETFIDASNYSRAFVRCNLGAYEIGGEAAGTPTARSLNLVTPSGALFINSNSSTVLWRFDTAGIRPEGDNNRDLGDSATRRFRSGYFGTSVSTPAVAFPAAQVPSSDPNTLDDYEEGTFTPTVTFGGASTGITYAARDAVYTKIGRAVHFRFYISLSSKGSATGVVNVAGLPFTNGAGLSYNGLSVWINLLNGIAGQVTGYVDAGGTTIVLQYLGTGSATQLTDANFNNNSAMMISGTYSV